jgi:predicted permease
MEYTVLAYFVGICLLSAVLFGLAPALRSSRVDLNHVLKEGGRGGTGRIGWLSGTLVVLQFTFAVVLLTGAGLMMRSFIAGENVNGWIPRSEILSARLELPNSRYATREARREFVERAEAQLAGLPGATGSAVANFLPGVGGLRTERIDIDGISTDQAARPSVPMVSVSPGYFALVNLPVLRGRGFNDRDGAGGSEVAIVTRTFASRFWPNDDAIGKRVRIWRRETPGEWMTIVGVSGELVQQSQTATPDALLFIPMRQDDSTFMVLAARTAGDASSLAGPVRAMVQRLDPELPLFDVETFETLVRNQHWPYRVFGSIFGIFALAALLMASVGLYAVMSQATSRRTREIGVRMALGATPGRILRSVLRRGAIQLSIGLVLGLGAAFAATGAMRTLLLGVQPTDPAVFIGTSVVLTSVGLLACWLPARRAALVPPIKALNDDSSL